MQGIENVPAVHQKIEIKGTCSERFEAVREAFKHNLDTAQDVGASVAIFVDGEPVVDLWGGHFDASYTRPFDRHSLVQCYSSTKTWGQYESTTLINLGYNRWAFKPELGLSHQIGRWTFDGYAGAWLFSANDAYYPGSATRRQDPVWTLQTHVS